MVPIDSEHDIQTDTSGAIPRGVLSQRGSDVSNTYREIDPHHWIAEISSVRMRTRLMHPRVMRLPRTPPRVIAELS